MASSLSNRSRSSCFWSILLSFPLGRTGDWTSLVAYAFLLRSYIGRVSKNWQSNEEMTVDRQIFLFFLGGRLGKSLRPHSYPSSESSCDLWFLAFFVAILWMVIDLILGWHGRGVESIKEMCGGMTSIYLFVLGYLKGAERKGLKTGEALDLQLKIHSSILSDWSRFPLGIDIYFFFFGFC